MKGLETRFLVLIVLALIVLISAIYFIYQSKGMADVSLYQNSLRTCCFTYCNSDSKSTGYMCKDPSRNDISIGELANKAGVSNIDDFCNC